MYKVVTAPTVEPVSLAEAKDQLNLTSGTFAGDTSTFQSIVPGAHGVIAAFGLTGAAADVLGRQAFANLSVGVCGTGGSITAKLQESDNGTAWQDVTGGAFVVVTESNDNAVQELAYSGIKRWLRVVVTVAAASCDFSVDIVSRTGDVLGDTWLAAKITAARQWCENHTGRALATQTLEYYLDGFPTKGEIRLPMAPLQSVTSITYTDSAGTVNTLAASAYIVDADGTTPRVVLAYGTAWPSFTPYPVNPIKVRYVAGFTTAPEAVKHALLLMVAHWYYNREASIEGALGVVDFSVRALLAQYRHRWFD